MYALITIQDDDGKIVTCSGIVRPEVAYFAMAMEAKLRRNDHKKGWRELPVEALKRMMEIEVEEFKVALEFLNKNDARSECIDIANFAMMLDDRLGMKDAEQQPVSA